MAGVANTGTPRRPHSSAKGTGASSPECSTRTGGNSLLALSNVLTTESSERNDGPGPSTGARAPPDPRPAPAPPAARPRPCSREAARAPPPPPPPPDDQGSFGDQGISGDHGVMEDVAEIAERLYGLLPEEFTAARDSEAKRIRASGDRESASAIAALRRPSLAAWLVNALVRHCQDEVEQLLGLGEAL